MKTGETKVEHFHLTIRGKENVGRLQVAVDDAFLVRRGQAVGNGGSDLHRLAPRQRSAFEPRAECLSVEQFHDRVDPLVGATNIVNGQDVGMRERRNRPSLTLEALARVGTCRRPVAHYLDRDIALEPRVVGSIHLAHPARADRGHNLIGAEAGARGQRHHVSPRLERRRGYDLTCSPVDVDGSSCDARKISSTGPITMRSP